MVFAHPHPLRQFSTSIDVSASRFNLRATRDPFFTRDYIFSHPRISHFNRLAPSSCTDFLSIISSTSRLFRYCFNTGPLNPFEIFRSVIGFVFIRPPHSLERTDRQRGWRQNTEIRSVAKTIRSYLRLLPTICYNLHDNAFTLF